MMDRCEAILACLLLAVLAAAPLFATNILLNFLVTSLIIALAAQGWNILGGYAGQFSFGHAAFFGIGAYTTAILQIRYGVNAWVALAIGTALTPLMSSSSTPAATPVTWQTSSSSCR